MRGRLRPTLTLALVVCWCLVSLAHADRPSEAAAAARDTALAQRIGQVIEVSTRTGRIQRRYRGKQRGDEFGSTHSFGDVPGDTGVFMIGAPGADGGNGRVWALNRDSKRVVFSLDGKSPGLAPLSRFGFRVSQLGHINGEATHWMASAPGTAATDGPDAAVVLLHVRDDSLTERLRLTQPPGSLFGFALLAVDNFFDDFLFDQIVAGAPTMPRDGKTKAGAVFAYSSETGAQEWALRGRRKNQHLGFSLLNLRDVDGDGESDFLVGAPGALPARKGKALIVSGATGRRLATLKAPAGARLFGFALTLADVDGDASLDYVVSAPATDGLAGERAGCLYAFSASGGLIWSRQGAEAGQWLGVALRRLPDRDGDGRDELLASSLFATGNPRTDSRGGVAVISPGTGSVLMERLGKKAGDRFGWRLFGSSNPEANEVPVGVPRGGVPYIPE